MNWTTFQQRAPFWLTVAAITAALVSTAACSILIACALASLLFSNTELRLPPVKLPLAIFMAGTLVSLMLSDDRWGGRPAIRKFYLFLVLLLVTSTFKKLAEVRILVLWLTTAMTASALYGFVQFYTKYEEAQALHRVFYDYYTGSRITGFMSHWMTLGGEEMMVILMASAFIFFLPHERTRLLLVAAVGIVIASLLVGFTRSIWLGTAIGGVFLIWTWKRWWILALPLPILLLLFANPVGIGDRMQSIFRPHGDTDSNDFRVVCRRTGWEMIKAHPFFGLGPEQVKAQFDKYVPADIRRPLPTGWYGHLHNIYYHYAAERGIPTMLALMWLLGKMLYDFSTGLRKKHSALARTILLGCVAVTLSMLAEGYYENNIGDGEPLTLFLGIASCGYLALRLDEPSAPDREAISVA